MPFPKKLNNRGQVALFIALIFQVLFLFFAMIINVGLLIHHKINLQNSVDLAAYYGAMKQAEMLNAVGHMNYQIRQSWKLLAWRYRQLGTAGSFSPAHPYNKGSKSIGTDNEDTLPGYDRFYDTPPFCVTYVPFRPMPPDENTCKEVYNGQQIIALPKVPPVIAGFLSFTSAIANATAALVASAEERCKNFGVWNYITLARFVTAYNMDIAQRKMLIKHLAMGMSETTEDFYDIEGDSVRTGIEKTLKNNLTEANRSAVDFKMFNSLGTAECGASGVGTYDPPKWLSEVKIFPTYVYTDTTCDKTKIQTDPKHLMFPPNYGNLPQFKQVVDYLKQFAGQAPAPFNSSMGYEKNPWCEAYVGITATAKPKIPFSPLGSVELKATAYAKPFGSRIGPWFSQRFPKIQAGPMGQSVGEKIDALLPPRANDASQLGDQEKDTTRIANFSRFPGDPLGMKSRRVLGQYGRAIYEMGGEGTRSVDKPTGISNNEPNFDHWKDLAQEFKVTKHGDILAWDDVGKQNNLMRQLELTAIAPDLFDISYYSIEPDFYANYFLKIRDSYLKKRTGYNDIPRSDLGSRVDDKELERFSVKDQLELTKKLNSQTNPLVELQNKLTYIVVNPTHVLTSWVGTSLTNYDLDAEKFGKCSETPKKDFPNPGNCVRGGRTGYSVKLISSDFLKSPQALGGEGAAPDFILNPPPNDF